MSGPFPCGDVMRKLQLFPWVIGLVCSPLAAQQRHTITHEDVFLMKRVGSPVISPDGRWIVFSVTEPSYTEGEQVSDLWLVPTDGSAEPRRITSLSTGASSPLWRPDGKAILFSSMIYPGATTDSANRAAAADRKARKYNARVFDASPIRLWDHWLDERRPHLFAQAPEPGAQAKDLLARSQLVQ